MMSWNYAKLAQCALRTEQPGANVIGTRLLIDFLFIELILINTSVSEEEFDLVIELFVMFVNKMHKNNMYIKLFLW